MVIKTVILIVIIAAVTMCGVWYNSNRNRYSRIKSKRGHTAGQIAESIMEQPGFEEISVRESENMADSRYDSSINSVCLSAITNNSEFIMDIAVAVRLCAVSVQDRLSAAFCMRVQRISCILTGAALLVSLFMIKKTDSTFEFIVDVAFIPVLIQYVFSMIGIFLEHRQVRKGLKFAEKTEMLEKSEIIMLKKALYVQIFREYFKMS